MLLDLNSKDGKQNYQWSPGPTLIHHRTGETNPQRVDYILINTNLPENIAAVEICTHESTRETADWPSDHYAVIASFKIKTRPKET